MDESNVDEPLLGRGVSVRVVPITGAATRAGGLLVLLMMARRSWCRGAASG
jgi:hypothetical protein